MSECIIRIPELSVVLEPIGEAITIELLSRLPTIDVELCGNVSRYPAYDGPYEMTPRTEAQTLNTAYQVMQRDVILHEIPYYETTNLSGGYTAIIGG